MIVINLRKKQNLKENNLLYFFMNKLFKKIPTLFALMKNLGILAYKIVLDMS